MPQCPGTLLIRQIREKAVHHQTPEAICGEQLNSADLPGILCPPLLLYLGVTILPMRDLCFFPEWCHISSLPLSTLALSLSKVSSTLICRLLLSPSRSLEVLYLSIWPSNTRNDSQERDTFLKILNNFDCIFRRKLTI